MWNLLMPNQIIKRLYRYTKSHKSSIIKEEKDEALDLLEEIFDEVKSDKET